jgi:hypothetical protein
VPVDLIHLLFFSGRRLIKHPNLLKYQKNELMKRQPLNMVSIPARLAPRTIPPLIELVLLFQAVFFFFLDLYGATGFPLSMKVR